MLPNIKDILDSMMQGVNARASKYPADPINLLKSAGGAVRGLGAKSKEIWDRSGANETLRQILQALKDLKPRGNTLRERWNDWIHGGQPVQRAQGAQGNWWQRMFARAPQQPPPLPPHLSSIAGRGRNFGDLLSGRVTAQQLIAREAASAAATRAGGSAAGAGAGAAAGGGGASAAGAGMALSRLAMGAGAVVGILAAMGFAGKRFAESMVESGRELAKFNGTIGRAYQTLARSDLMRQRELAGATAESTEVLTAAVDQMRGDLQPLKAAVGNGLNYLGAGIAILIGQVGQLLTKVGVGVGLIDKWLGGDKKGALTDWELWIRNGANKARIDAQKRLDAQRQMPPLEKP